MSNLNDFEFSNKLEQFRAKVLEPQKKRTDEAFKIMSDLSYPWKSKEQKESGQARLDSYQQWLKFYEDIYN